MAGGKVEIINSKGCSRLLVGISSAFPYLRGLQSYEPPSPAVSVASEIRTSGPFAGLIICVTGLSKEARKQVMDATERLGGQYSPNLNPQCTHLVVQSFGGRKFEHALKHGLRNGLFIVTLGWFVDSVRRNVRLNESLYNVKSVGENGSRMEELNRLLGSSGAENSCLPMVVHDNAKQSNMTQHAQLQLTAKEPARSRESALAGHSIYVDPDISPELRSKIVEVAAREGASFVDHWFIGCSATHVVCEEPSIQKYLGHASNLVTPLWILKTVKERCVQRLVHMSADVARQVSILLERKETNRVGGLHDALISRECPAYRKDNESIKERQQIIYLAKTGARNRRDRRMQTCQNPIRPITPGSLLDSMCWSISEPTSSASIYTETSHEDVNEHTSLFYDARGDVRSETSFENLARPLRESEKMELVFRNHFLTILFPIDRFGEMGPSSRTFFSDKGFTCLQVLDLIYAFYQENMSADEVDSAIHTDSRYADRLRSVYANMETAQRGFVQFKRIDFLGSRKSFEMLKRVSGDNSSNVYELLIRA